MFYVKTSDKSVSLPFQIPEVNWLTLLRVSITFSWPLDVPVLFRVLFEWITFSYTCIYIFPLDSEYVDVGAGMTHDTKWNKSIAENESDKSEDMQNLTQKTQSPFCSDYNYPIRSRMVHMAVMLEQSHSCKSCNVALCSHLRHASRQDI